MKNSSPTRRRAAMPPAVPPCTVSVDRTVYVGVPGWDVTAAEDLSPDCLVLEVTRCDTRPDEEGAILPLGLSDGRWRATIVTPDTLRALGLALLTAADTLAARPT